VAGPSSPLLYARDVRTQVCAGHVVLLLLAMLVAESPGRPAPGSRVRVLLEAGLIAGHVGMCRQDANWLPTSWSCTSYYDAALVGAGVQWHNVGVMLRWTLAGRHGSPLATYGGAWDRTTYLEMVYGASDRRASLRPVLYAYTSLCRVHEYFDADVGIGARWRFYAVSPDVRVSWRRVTEPQLCLPPMQRDLLEASLGLELGGLWALSIP
jgi:hypothetical protein